MTPTPKSEPTVPATIGQKIGNAIGILIVCIVLLAVASLFFTGVLGMPGADCPRCEAQEMRDYGSNGDGR